MKMKAAIIGAGNVGSSLALLAAKASLADIVLFDVLEGVPEGKALDIQEACPLWGSSAKVKGTNDYADIEGSDVVVITAGLARKPGMSRDDLLLANADIVRGAAREIGTYCPGAVVIVVTNPMDVMAHLLWKTTGFEAGRVVGMGGILDSARLKAFISMELGVSPSDVEAMVLGGHGDQMVPVRGSMTIGGAPLVELLGGQRIEALLERTRNGGAEIVSLLKSGSAYYAPAASAMEMLRAVLLDEKRLLPCAAYLSGQYGAEGIFIGVPVVLGRRGVEKVVEFKLEDKEAEEFRRSVDSVRGLVSKLGH